MFSTKTPLAPIILAIHEWIYTKYSLKFKIKHGKEIAVKTKEKIVK